MTDFAGLLEHVQSSHIHISVLRRKGATIQYPGGGGRDIFEINN